MGVGIGIERRVHALEDALNGWPDHALTCLLVAVALFLLFVAWRATALEKAIVAGWVVFP